jgi:hypothetical protein
MKLIFNIISLILIETINFKKIIKKKIKNFHLINLNISNPNKKKYTLSSQKKKN